jgi:hypothetical protein
MIRKLSMWLLVALVGGALLAGCGSSSSSSSQTSSAPASTTATTPTTSTSSSDSDKGGSSSTPTGATAVARCREGVKAAASLPASTRSKLEEICNKAGSGDPDAVRKAAREACVELINVSPLPDGAAKEKALASCNKK